jgi:hypothetical protein
MKTRRSTGKTTRTRKAALRRQPTKKKAKSDIMLTTLAVGAAGILGYLGWQYLRKKKSSSGSSDLYAMLNTSGNAVNPPASVYTPPTPDVAANSPVPKKTTASSSTSPTSSPAADGFPLKKGSKGEKVRSLQQALIAKFGASILPKYGADGDFGSETVVALKKAGLPATIDATAYYVFVQGSGSSGGSFDKKAVATKLLDAAVRADFSTVMGQLKLLNTKEDYRQVGEIFSQSRLRGVRQTLVNGLLGTFSSEEQKQQIRYEFMRMGLKYDGNKWSLDGFDGKSIITTEATNVWMNATKSLPVPAMMVLGAEVSRRLDYTLFENNRRYFLVSTKSVKYL